MSPGRVPTGVVVMAYGTPSGLDEVEAYYTHIRRGRPPSPAQLDHLLDRYRAIGGVSPLREITQAQAAAIQRALDDIEAGRYRVYLGMKHADPMIEDAVATMRADGIEQVVGLVLAPHYARMSVGEYVHRVREAAGETMDTAFVDGWHLAPGYLDLLAASVREALGAVPAAGATHVLFTAHSLPSRIVAEGDAYPARVHETGQAVARMLGLERWSMAWQSAGATPEPWLGPDLKEAIPTLAATGASAVVVCACGFVADHLEVLYDVDIEARQVATEHGLAFARTRMPNDDPRLAATLAALVDKAAPPALPHVAPDR